MFTPAQVAKKARVTAQSIRNYSRDYAELLSPTASGENGPRLYTDEDVEILCTIAALRKTGIPTDEIADRVRNPDAPPVIDATPQTPLNDPQEPPKTESEALLVPQIVLSTINARFEGHDRLFEALQRQLDNQVEQQKAERRDRFTLISLGIIIGMVAALVLFVGAYLLLTVGR